jgi:ACS family tartrate transporter-like MFS transporter
VVYVLNHLDRVNVGYAALQMTGDLGFSNAVFGFGAGIFFVGYLVFQIPGTLLIELWSARRFIGISLIVWGALATSTALITNAQQFYTIRVSWERPKRVFFPA